MWHYHPCIDKGGGVLGGLHVLWNYSTKSTDICKANL